MQAARLEMLTRALTLVRMLDRSRLVRPTAGQVAQALGVSERTAKRWLKAAQETQIPMAAVVSNGHEEAW